MELPINSTMSSVVYGLVLVSTLSHAYWNYLLKRAGGGTVFLGLSKVVEVVILAPAFVWTLAVRRTPVGTAPLLVVVGAALVLANYAALARAYALSDLSFAYPVSRAGALFFLPGLGYIVFDEHLSIAGGVAMALIVVGMAVMQLPQMSWSAVATLVSRSRAGGAAFALVAAFAAAAYTVWDKRAVNQMPAFIYFYAYTAIVAAAYACFLLTRHSLDELRTEWRDRRWSIIQVGVFNSATYLLVLVALRSGTSSYVVAVRQLSIVWGVLLGQWLLGERVLGPRRIGVGLLLAGCALVAVSG